MPVLARMLSLCLLGCLAWTLACASSAGRFSKRPSEPSAEATISLVAIGGLFPGARTRKVAAELDRVLQRERSAGRDPILVWTGGLGYTRRPEGPCASLGANWGRRGLRELGEVARRHTKAGGASFAVFGLDDWRCGTNAADPGAEGLWRRPADNYVLRVDAEGRTRAVSTCDESGACQIAPPENGVRLELVFLDVTPWAFPELAGKISDASLRQQAGLLEALDRAEPTARVLIMPLPVETAGIHGKGGTRPSVSFLRLPAPVQRRIAAGMFVGAIGGHDRSLQATLDATDAVKRSAKVWLQAPMFQVVSASAGHPEAGGIRLIDRLSRQRGLTIRPQLASTAPGFARVVVSEQTVDLVLHARRSHRWRQASLSMPLFRAPHPVEGPAPSMAPCIRCRPRPMPIATDPG